MKFRATTGTMSVIIPVLVLGLLAVMFFARLVENRLERRETAVQQHLIQTREATDFSVVG